MSLPNEIVNNIINYSMDGEEDICKNCKTWRDNQFLIKCLLGIKRIHNRNVEDDILIFLTVNKIPPYDCVKQFLKISKKKYDTIYDILWMLGYSQETGDVKENIKLLIESKKFNVQNTVRDVNIIFKMMYERSKTNQLDYYPELKL